MSCEGVSTVSLLHSPPWMFCQRGDYLLDTPFAFFPSQPTTTTFTTKNPSPHPLLRTKRFSTAYDRHDAGPWIGAPQRPAAVEPAPCQGQGKPPRGADGRRMFKHHPS